jgi:hypothetical protein
VSGIGPRPEQPVRVAKESDAPRASNDARQVQPLREKEGFTRNSKYSKGDKALGRYENVNGSDKRGLDALLKFRGVTLIRY